MIGWILDTVDGVRSRRVVLGPVVIVGRRQENAREIAAYRFGRLSAGIVDVQASSRSHRHLRSV